MTTDLTEGVSVPQIIRVLLMADPVVQAVAPGGVFVGPASLEEQQPGCITLNENGQGSPTGIPSVLRQRMSVRCLSATRTGPERISRSVYGCLHEKGRRVVTQLSDGKRYLVHFTNVQAGPSGMEPEGQIWEDDLIVEALVGTEEITA
jgi:hypothetical protein